MVDWVVCGIAIPVRPDSSVDDLEPIGLEEQAKFGVVVPGVQVLQASAGVKRAGTRMSYRVPLGGVL